MGGGGGGTPKASAAEVEQRAITKEKQARASAIIGEAMPAFTADLDKGTRSTLARLANADVQQGFGSLASETLRANAQRGGLGSGSQTSASNELAGTRGQQSALAQMKASTTATKQDLTDKVKLAESLRGISGVEDRFNLNMASLQTQEAQAKIAAKQAKNQAIFSALGNIAGGAYQGYQMSKQKKAMQAMADKYKQSSTRLGIRDEEEKPETNNAMFTGFGF